MNMTYSWKKLTSMYGLLRAILLAKEKKAFLIKNQKK